MISFVEDNSISFSIVLFTWLKSLRRGFKLILSSRDVIGWHCLSRFLINCERQNQFDFPLSDRLFLYNDWVSRDDQILELNRPNGLKSNVWRSVCQAEIGL